MSLTLILLIGTIIILSVLIAFLAVKIDTFKNVNGGCMNKPPQFKKAYSSYPNLYKIANIPAPGLGANTTMVVANKGSCSSNINNISKRTPGHFSYCENGSNNFF